MCSCTVGERPLVSDWDRGAAAEAVGVNQNAVPGRWYRVVRATSETKAGRWDLSQIIQNKCRIQYQFAFFLMIEGGMMSLREGFSFSDIIHKLVWQIYFILGLICGGKKDWLYTFLKQMQSHFVHTCEVSNYTEQISTMSQPNIHLVPNEHL